MNFEKNQIVKQLETILVDKAFSRSKTNCRLLKFLVTSTLAGEDLKESTIGEAFFGSNYDPIKSDNNVRVYIYHLRKKLREYYNTNANPNEIVFTITKGQYNVQFSEFQKDSTSKKAFSFTALISVVLLFTAAFIYFYKNPANDFWQTLMKNNFPTTVIFGDYFTIEGTVATGGEGIIRDYEINSEQELQDFLSENPEQEGQLKASQHHYFNWMAPYCSKTITEFWSDSNYPFDIKQVSEWNVSQLGKENIVYFGQSKAMGVLKNILIENFPQYTYKSQKIIRKDTDTGKSQMYGSLVSYSEKIIDYTVVAKVTMPKGSEMRFFLSDQDCGAISALQYFTQKDSVSAFYKRHQIKKEDDFLALFKVTGWQRKSYDMEFVLIDQK